MNELGREVRRLRTWKGLSQQALADKVTVDRSYISMIENGKVPDPGRNLLIALARQLETPIEALLTLAGYLTAKDGLGRSRSPEEAWRELQDTLPVLVPEATQYAHAGESSTSYLDAEPWAYYPRAEERRHDFVAIPVNGSCMEPRIRKGERVVVDKSASPRPGDIVVAIHKGEALVKELKREGDKLVLTAIGPQPPIEVNAETEILGVVRMVMHRP